ncbi:MAG: hypothetical protein EpisKO_18520 [Epibacterium sp.]
MQRDLAFWIGRLLLVVGLLSGVAPSAARAICDVDYVVQPGDNLFTIAEAHYGDRDRWTVIYYRNQGELAGPSVIPGRTLFIPCPPNMPIESAPADAVVTQETTPAPTVQPAAELNLLTGGQYAPFTDPDLPEQGLITELVRAALEVAPSPVPYAIGWDNDWSQHLSPKLESKQFDMGFPWAKPDCADDPSAVRCVRYHYSDPLMEVPVMLFVRSGGGMVYGSDADVIGKTLCRPLREDVFDLDTAARRWISDDKVTLVQPAAAGDCLRMVADGRVDAAALNLFVGASALVAERLRGRVEPLEKPLSQVSLHVIISKTHWRGTSHLYRMNAGLRHLRESGRYDEIVSRHMELFWSGLQ